MDISSEQELRQLADQLRKPEGAYGSEVAKFMNEGNLPMNLHALAVLNPSAGESILEIGMGNGYFVKNILNLDPSIHYIGCDYSPEMVEISSENNQDFIDQGRARFFMADASEMPVEDHSIDKVITINTLYFWENVHATLAEIKRVLKPNGTFYLAVRPKHILKALPVTKFGFKLYNNDKIFEMLRFADFQDVMMTSIVEPTVERHGERMNLETVIYQAKVGGEVSVA